MTTQVGVVLGNDAKFGGEYEVKPIMAVVNTNVPSVDPGHQRQRRESMNKGHRAGVELEVVVEIGPHYGVVAISQRDKVPPLADGLDHPRLEFDDDPLRGVV